MAYKLQKCGVGVIRLRDMASIPDCKDNADWQEYLEWKAKGNTPLPAWTAAELAEKQKVDEAATQEALIATKMRELAVTELKKEGKLPTDFKSLAMGVSRGPI